MALEPPLTDAAETKLKQVRDRIEAALHDLVSDMLVAATAERDTAVSEAQAQGAAAADAQQRAAQSLAAEREATERRLAEAKAQMAAQLEEDRAAERQCDLACLERLVDAVRDFDGAASLSQVLDKLADHAALHVARIAILVVRDSELRPWRTVGFDQSAADLSAMKLPLDAPTVVRQAIDTGARATTGSGVPGAALEPLPFVNLPADRVGLALPLTVGVRTVAVLYADEGPTTEPAVPSAWPEVLEILSRHAACRLEMLTVARAYGLHAQPFDPAQGRPFDSGRGEPRTQGAHGEQAGPAGPAARSNTATVVAEAPADQAGRLTPPAGGRPPSLATDKPVEAMPHAEESRQISEEDASALRYARLLISEIKLYHEDAVNEGRRDGNLLARLGPEIARARKLYDERIPADVRSRADLFGQELVRTLANGDPRLLGQDR